MPQTITRSIVDLDAQRIEVFQLPDGTKKIRVSFVGTDSQGQRFGAEWEVAGAEITSLPPARKLALLDDLRTIIGEARAALELDPV